MNIGSMRDTLIFQAPILGGQSWTTIFTAKGQKCDLTGAEKIAALSSGGIITGFIWMRWKPVHIKTTWRIVFENRYMNIISAPKVRLPEGLFYKIHIKEVA